MGLGFSGRGGDGGRTGKAEMPKRQGNPSVLSLKGPVKTHGLPDQVITGLWVGSWSCLPQPDGPRDKPMP